MSSTVTGSVDAAPENRGIDLLRLHYGAAFKRSGRGRASGGRFFGHGQTRLLVNASGHRRGHALSYADRREREFAVPFGHGYAVFVLSDLAGTGGGELRPYAESG